MARASRIAEALREEPPQLDEVGRARMEKRLVEAVRDRDRGGAKRTSSAPPPRRRTAWVAGGVALAAAAALVLAWMGAGGVVAPSDGHGGGELAAASATYQTFQDGETVRRGALAEGETISTVRGQRVEVRVPDVRIDVTPASVARLDRIGGDDVEVSVERGAIEVEFHPERRGEQSLAVHTPAARVEVIGTVFRVEVDGERATTVRVQEGVVRVVPLAGGQPRRVRAGEAARVEADPPERASAAEADAPAVAVREAPRSHAEGPEPDLEVSSVEEAPVEEGTIDDGSPDVEDPPAPALSLDARFDLADRYLERGQTDRARHLWYQIARSPIRRAHRVRAWQGIADSFERDADHRQAAEAYRRAADLGRGTLQGRNALYALAVVRERRLGDVEGAKAAYRQYIQQAAEAQLRGQPSPHLDLSVRALCRLGDRAYCRSE